MSEKFSGEWPDSNRHREGEEGRKYEVDAVIAEMRALLQNGSKEEAIELFRLWADAQERERGRLDAADKRDGIKGRSEAAKFFGVEIEWSRARICAEAWGDREEAYEACKTAEQIAHFEMLGEEILQKCEEKIREYEE